MPKSIQTKNTQKYEVPPLDLEEEEKAHYDSAIKILKHKDEVNHIE